LSERGSRAGLRPPFGSYPSSAALILLLTNLAVKNILAAKL
jgi:hypothetical protein